MEIFKIGDRALIARSEHRSNNGRVVELIDAFSGTDGTPHWRVRDVEGGSFAGYNGYVDADGVKCCYSHEYVVSEFLGIEESKLDKLNPQDDAGPDLIALINI
jgi:hypothetical protein